MSVDVLNKIEELKVLDFTYWVVSVNSRQLIFGSLLISLKRSCSETSNLKLEEAKELALIFSKTERILNEAFHCERINYQFSTLSDNRPYIEVLPNYSKPLDLEGIAFKDIYSKDNETIKIDFWDEVAQHVFNILKRKNNKKIIGYSTGVFDLFHVGHLNILEQAKNNCDFHLVGVTTDEEVMRIKGVKPVIPFSERLRIVGALTCVDQVIPESNVDKLKSWENHNFDVIFKGDDWKGTEKWNKLEEEFSKINVQVKYFPYTQGTSSTHLKNVLTKIMESK